MRGIGKSLDYCSQRGVDNLGQIKPMLVAAFIEEETKCQQPQTAKQELAAILLLLDYLVVTQVIPHNPAGPVRGPRYSNKKARSHYCLPIRNDFWRGSLYKDKGEEKGPIPSLTPATAGLVPCAKPF